MYFSLTTIIFYKRQVNLTFRWITKDCTVSQRLGFYHSYYRGCSQSNHSWVSYGSYVGSCRARISPREKYLSWGHLFTEAHPNMYQMYLLGLEESWRYLYCCKFLDQIQKLLTGILPIGQIILWCICINLTGFIRGLNLSHGFLQMQFKLGVLRSLNFFRYMQISHVRVEKHDSDAKLISLNKYQSQIYKVINNTEGLLIQIYYATMSSCLLPCAVILYLMVCLRGDGCPHYLLPSQST